MARDGHPRWRFTLREILDNVDTIRADMEAFVPTEDNRVAARDDVMHVLPRGDLIAHESLGTDCPCGPRVDTVSGGFLVVHHSLDGRELTEPDDQSGSGS